MESTEKIWILYAILLSLNYLIAEKITIDKRNAARLIQFIYFKNVLTPKFKHKGKLLGKRISSFVSTENEELRISSRLMWFDQARPPETAPQVIQHSKHLRQSLADYSQDFCIFLGSPMTAPPTSRKQFGKNSAQIPKYCL